jgi:hypothetical protein
VTTGFLRPLIQKVCFSDLNETLNGYDYGEKQIRLKVVFRKQRSWKISRNVSTTNFMPKKSIT